MRKPGDEEKKAPTQPAQRAPVVELPKGTTINQKDKAKVVKEFKAWKKILLDMVKTGARLVINRDGSYEFVLPPRLVKLVWNVAIKERMKVAVARGSKNPQRDALQQLRSELDILSKAKFGESESESEQNGTGKPDEGGSGPAGSPQGDGRPGDLN